MDDSSSFEDAIDGAEEAKDGKAKKLGWTSTWRTKRAKSPTTNVVDGSDEDEDEDEDLDLKAKSRVDHFKSIDYLDKDVSSIFSRIAKRFGLVFAFSGIAFNLWLYIRSRGLRNMCEQKVEKCVWQASHPKLYFRDGLASAPDCHFDWYTELDISHYCTELSADTLVKIISEYKNLETLTLTGVGLDTIPENLPTHNKIQNVFMKDNNITRFPSSFFNFGNATTFSVDFTENPVADDFAMDNCGMDTLPRWFKANNMNNKQFNNERTNRDTPLEVVDKFNLWIEGSNRNIELENSEILFKSLNLDDNRFTPGILKELHKRGIKARAISLKNNAMGHMIVDDLPRDGFMCPSKQECEKELSYGECTVIYDPDWSEEESEERTQQQRDCYEEKSTRYEMRELDVSNNNPPFTAYQGAYLGEQMRFWNITTEWNDLTTPGVGFLIEGGFANVVLNSSIETTDMRRFIFRDGFMEEYGDWDLRFPFNWGKLEHISAKAKQFPLPDWFFNEGFNESLLQLHVSKSPSFKDVKDGELSRFKNLESLFLNMNAIKNVDDNAFITLEKLRSLRMYNNVGKDMKRLSGFDFLEHIPNPQLLEALDLSENEVENVQGNNTQVSRFKNLQLLSLRDSRVELIEADALEGMDDLTLVDLSKNNVSSIDSRHFQNKTRLLTVWLEENGLTSVPDRAFHGTNSLLEVRRSEKRVKRAAEKVVGLGGIICAIVIHYTL